MKVKLKSNLGKEYSSDPKAVLNGMVVNVDQKRGERLIAKGLADPSNEPVTKYEPEHGPAEPVLDDMTIPELREMATQKNVEIPAAAHKDEIVKALKKAK